MVGAVAPQRHPSRRDGLDRRDRVALDARDLHQAADGVTRQPQVVLDADLGGVLDLRGRTPRQLDHSRGGHGASRSDLSLAPHLRARNRRVRLAEDADGTRRQQEPDDGVVVEPGDEVAAVVQHGGHDSGGPVGRSSHDAAARSVLLVDRECVQGNPIHGAQRVGVTGVGVELRAQRRGPPSHPELAGKHARGRHSAGRTLLHRLPDLEQPGPYLVGGTQHRLVGHHQLAHAERRAGGELQQFRGGGEGERHLGLPGSRPGVRPDLVLVEHESSSDGEVFAGRNGVAPSVQRMEADAVGVLGQSLPDVKDDVSIDREGNGMRSTQPDLAVGPHPVQ